MLEYVVRVLGGKVTGLGVEVEEDGIGLPVAKGMHHLNTQKLWFTQKYAFFFHI